MPADSPIFLCDAMLGGLARWLRAAGYDARYEYGIDDRRLVEFAGETGGVLLSSDGPMFERNVIRDGTVKALYIPQQLDKFQQLEYVLTRMGLERRDPRCMSCGGELAQVPKHQVAGEVPPIAFRRCERFWRCSRCGKLYWHGTHWQRITDRLAKITAGQADESA